MNGPSPSSRRAPAGQISEEHWLILEVCRDIVHNGFECELPSEFSKVQFYKAMLAASEQKLLPLLAFKVIPNKDLVPYRTRSLLWDALTINKERHKLRYKVAEHIHSTFSSHKIPCLPRKGIVYQNLLYGNTGTRVYGDIDFYLHREDGRRGEQILLDLGYRYGNFDRIADRVIGGNKRELLYFRLFPDHAPQLHIKEKCSFNPATNVDLAMDMAWHDSVYSEPLGLFLRNALNEGKNLKELSSVPITFHFVDCALHLFREGFFERSIANGSDVNLSKFMDLALLWKKLTAVEWKLISTVIDECSIQKPVAWAAFHTDEIFSTDIIGKLALGKHLEDNFQNSWSSSNGEIRPWRGDIFDRLFGESPIELFFDEDITKKPKAPPAGAFA